MASFNDKYWASSAGLKEATLEDSLVKLSSEYQVKTTYTPSQSSSAWGTSNEGLGTNTPGTTAQFVITDVPLMLTEGSYLRLDVNYYMTNASTSSVAFTKGTGVPYPVWYPRNSADLIQTSNVLINTASYQNQNHTGIHSDILSAWESMDYYKSTIDEHQRIYTPADLGIAANGNYVVTPGQAVAPWVHLEKNDFIHIFNKATTIAASQTAAQAKAAGQMFTKSFIIPARFVNDVFSAPMLNIYTTANPLLTVFVNWVDQLKQMLTIKINTNLTWEPYFTGLAFYTKTIINFQQNLSASKALRRFNLNGTYVLPYFQWYTMTNGEEAVNLKGGQSRTITLLEYSQLYNVISAAVVIRTTGASPTQMPDYFLTGVNDGDNFNPTNFSNGLYALPDNIKVSNFNILVTANNTQLMLKSNMDETDIVEQNSYSTGYMMDEDNGMNYIKISKYSLRDGYAVLLFNLSDIFNDYYHSGLMVTPSSTLKVQFTLSNTNAATDTNTVGVQVLGFVFSKMFFTCSPDGITDKQQLNPEVEADRLADE